MQPAFTQNIQNDAGTAIIQLTRLPGTPGASGSGVLVNLNFSAMGRGSTNISAPNLVLRTTPGQPVTVDSPAVMVNVR